MYTTYNHHALADSFPITQEDKELPNLSFYNILFILVSEDENRRSH